MKLPMDLPKEEVLTERALTILEARFWPMVDKQTEHWIWRAAKLIGGHGRFEGEPAAKVVWWLLKGPIPEGMHMGHKCGRTDCVKPDHVYPVTPKENASDIYRRQSPYGMKTPGYT